jgi:hypothetical protein
LSLYVAERGEKGYLREAWSAREFDLGRACRRWGRNDAFWVLCYRRHLAGSDLPSGAELNALVRRANVATGGRSRRGDPQPYTRYEARETVKQVSGYPSAGLLPMLARGRGKTSAEQAILDAVRSVARASARHTFTASHRQLSAASGVPLARVGELLRRLERRRLVWLVGHTKALPGRSSGTSIWSVRPPRPAQMVDEACPPVYDAKRCRWVWAKPSDKGVVSGWSLRAEVAKASRRGVPNVLIPSLIRDLVRHLRGEEDLEDRLQRLKT